MFTTETRIADAYKTLTAGNMEWVRLAHLREQLNGIPTARVNAALYNMSEKSRIRLTCDENTRTLTAADRAASLTAGPNEMHLIAMEITSADAQPDYAAWTVKELRALCKARGWKGYSRMKKASLVQLVCARTA